jgi:SPP1 family predicted phage head-tail adaptor
MKGRQFFITIQAKTETPDGQGGFGVAWNQVGQCWAEILPMKGFQKLAYEKIDSKISHKILFRSQIVIKDGYQIICRGRTFEVKGAPINIEERDEYREVTCREIF